MGDNVQEAIVVENLQKSFGKLRVLDGIGFSAGRGAILALLGPNGAGKTTTIRILSTLLLPSAGKASINGHDVVREADKVRAVIGLTGQYTAVDEYLTGEENLHMIGRLYHLSKEDTKRRTAELLDQFELKAAANRPVKTYSGGMRRRLDLAASLIASPPVIFLDEPTTGLDPPSRFMMWEMIEKLAKEGTTILLTTQHMEEADRLAERIIVIDGGKIIAEGAPSELKRKIGSERLEIVVKKSSFEAAKSALAGSYDEKNRSIMMATESGVHELKRILAKLEREGIEVESVSLHKPTLDDVFLTLTGHSTEGEKNG